MSHATFTFGRFNPPTESGHGKLVSAVKDHAEKSGGAHYVFASHSQDKKKNPLNAKDKTHVMKKLFPGTNVVSHPEVKNAIHALKHLQDKGHTHATMVVGDDRVGEFHKLLHAYNGKEYNFKKISVKSAGKRDPNATGAEGMSASKLRGLVSAGKKDEFVSHYSDKKLGAHIHDKVKKAMNESSKAMFILGGPGSGKDYVINNILSRFDLVEVQMDQILNGFAKHLIEAKANLLINGNADIEKILLVKSILENYEFSHTIVSVSNKVSRLRNDGRMKPMNESARIRKWLDAESINAGLTNTFIFKNSINLTEASTTELKTFQDQIEAYLGFIIENEFVMEDRVVIHSPKNKFAHGKEARVFYRHGDGRVNVQVKTGTRKHDINNYTLKPGQYKEVSEVLEWGTDETTNAFKAATPGETPVDVSKMNKAVNSKPKLTMSQLRKRGLITPPKEINARIDGAGGYNLGQPGAGGGLAGLYNS